MYSIYMLIHSDPFIRSDPLSTNELLSNTGVPLVVKCGTFCKFSKLSIHHGFLVDCLLLWSDSWPLKYMSQCFQQVSTGEEKSLHSCLPENYLQFIWTHEREINERSRETSVTLFFSFLSASAIFLWHLFGFLHLRNLLNFCS